MSNDSGEKRQFSRVPFDAEANIIGTSKQWSSKLLDVSLNGALVEKPEGWDAHKGDHLSLEILLGEHADLIIQMEVVVVAHVEENCIGLKCEHIDVESIAHLKRLMELNVGNADLINRELSALGSLF